MIRALRYSFVALLVGLILPAAACAVIHPASVIAGPSNEIVEADGTALAPDGSGGIVFRRRADGASHVFVVPFVDGKWGEAVRADPNNPFEASQPAIAAGSEGRLLVVWVQPRNVNERGITEYALMGASLQPGASTFGQAVMIDANVGEPFTGDASSVDPALAMEPNGTAYVVYRVVLDDCSLGDEANPEEPRCRPGTTDKVMSVRVARFEYLRWSSVGAINHSSQVAMRNPTLQNAPAIGIDVKGNGLVAWQEPGSDSVARIWVRRLFGTVPGNPLEASPEQLEGRPVTSDADAPAVAMSPYGEARIAYRIEGAPGSAVSASALFVNSISNELGLNAANLNGSSPIPGAAQGGLGTPSVSIDQRGNWRLAWPQGGALQELTGTERTLGSPATVGGSGEQVQTTINPAGGGTTAWLTHAGAAPVVDVHEDFAEGAFQSAQLSGGVPGPVERLLLGGDGQGDALLAWTQGVPGQAEVVGAFVQAPPAPFNLVAPQGWVRPAGANISWEPSPDAVQGVTYTIYIDGKPRMSGLTGLSTRLSPVALGDGVHHVQVLATDPAGQQTMSTSRNLEVDGNPPIVRVTLVDHRHGVQVNVTDKASGVDTRATVITFGDGRGSKGHAKAKHVYGHAGPYTITALVRDNIGNKGTVHIHVRVQ